jgi:hypothetical protein
LRVLHDRRIPGTQANIDHIAITSTGIYVIDAKRHVGKRPTLLVEGGVIRPRVERLMVGGRDQTKLVDGVLRRVDLVRSIVGVDTLVTGVLCFVEADWPLVGGAFTFRSVEVMCPGGSTPAWPPTAHSLPASMTSTAISPLGSFPHDPRPDVANRGIFVQLDAANAPGADVCTESRPPRCTSIQILARYRPSTCVKTTPHPGGHGVVDTV